MAFLIFHPIWVSPSPWHQAHLLSLLPSSFTAQTLPMLYQDSNSLLPTPNVSCPCPGFILECLPLKTPKAISFSSFKSHLKFLWCAGQALCCRAAVLLRHGLVLKIWLLLLSHLSASLAFHWELFQHWPQPCLLVAKSLEQGRHSSREFTYS